MMNDGLGIIKAPEMYSYTKSNRSPRTKEEASRIRTSSYLLEREGS